MYGVRLADGSDIPTKKGLKGAFGTNPGNVYLYDTSAFSPEMDRNGADLEIGRKYTVVGPNPYTARNWYATVQKTLDGRILVR